MSRLGNHSAGAPNLTPDVSNGTSVPRRATSGQLESGVVLDGCPIDASDSDRRLVLPQACAVWHSLSLLAPHSRHEDKTLGASTEIARVEN